MSREYENEDFDDTGSDAEGGEPSSSGAKGENTRASEGKGSGSRYEGKPQKADWEHGREVVEEALAQQRLRSGDPYAYRSGFGKTGAKRAEMLKFEQIAKANKTTVPAALRDYSGIEDAARRHPLLGVEALAQRMGWNSRELAAAYAQSHYGNDGGRQIGSAAAQHNNAALAQAVLDEASSHPANVHLRDPAAADWMIKYMNQPMPDGRSYSAHMAENIPNMRQRLAHVYQAYDKALRAHKASQKLAEMEDLRHDPRAYAKKVLARMGG
jgi:hypothetical protein